MMHSDSTIFILFGFLVLLLVGLTFVVRVHVGHEVESDHPRHAHH